MIFVGSAYEGLYRNYREPTATWFEGKVGQSLQTQARKNHGGTGCQRLGVCVRDVFLANTEAQTRVITGALGAGKSAPFHLHHFVLFIPQKRTGRDVNPGML